MEFKLSHICGLYGSKRSCIWFVVLITLPRVPRASSPIPTTDSFSFSVLFRVFWLVAMTKLEAILSHHTKIGSIAILYKNVSCLYSLNGFSCHEFSVHQFIIKKVVVVL